MLPKLLKSQYQAEMVAKLTLSLIQAHHGPIAASQELLPQIEEIKILAMKQISTLRVLSNTFSDDNCMFSKIQNKLLTLLLSFF